jgi:hypothetical protein
VGAVKGLVIACACSGSPAKTDSDSIRELIIYIIHSLTSRLVFRKNDSKSVGGGIRLILNVITFGEFRHAHVGVTAAPRQIRTLDQQPILLSAHYFCLEHVIRQNKRGGGGVTTCADASHLAILFGTRFYLDEGMLCKAIDLFKSQDDSYKHIDSPGQALLYLEEGSSLRGKSTKFKKKGGLIRNEGLDQTPDIHALYGLLLAKERLSELRRGFYYTYYMDFRGRTYSDGILSYTHNK